MKSLPLVAIFCLSVSCPRSALSTEVIPSETDKVDKVIQRTKVVSTTYAVYFWNHGRSPSLAASDEWSAEFHSGSQHRVETPRDRVIADCKAGTGAYLNVASGQIIRGAQVAAAACGINTARRIVSTKWMGRVQTGMGSADRVQITDTSNVRTYDISKDGIILASVYALVDSPQPIILRTWALAIRPNLPDKNMFDEASLQRSFVPERYKIAPARN